MSKKPKNITVTLTPEQLNLLKTGLDLVRDDARDHLLRYPSSRGLKREERGNPSAQANQINEIIDCVNELENILKDNSQNNFCGKYGSEFLDFSRV